MKPWDIEDNQDHTVTLIYHGRRLVDLTQQDLRALLTTIQQLRKDT